MKRFLGKGLIWLMLSGLFLLAAQAGPEPYSRIVTPSGVAMIFIPAGVFALGCSQGSEDEAPCEVSVGAFFMDQTEVTQESYQALMGENPSKVKDPANPVEQVRWSDAVRYCNARSKAEGLDPCYDLETWTCRFEANGYRLPTEAEWEYAARAGTRTQYFFGDSADKLKFFGWYKDTAKGRPRPVAGRKANPWGLHDMYGNVWEWCNDFYAVDTYASNPKQDPRGPGQGDRKVLRGGCWSSTPEACRSSYRYHEAPGYTDVCFGYDIYGFRCVRPWRE